MIDIEKLRMEIAEKCKVMIPANDPILLTALISDTCLQSALNELKEAQQKNLTDLSAIHASMVENDKNNSEQVITEGSQYIIEQSSKAINATVTENLEKLRLETKKSEAALNNAADIIKRLEVAGENQRDQNKISAVLGASVAANIIFAILLIKNLF